MSTIVSIKKLKLKSEIPVYDIEVPGNDNFILSSGAVVHNSKDCSDSLGGALLNSLQYKDEFLFFNPDDFDYEDINDDYNLQESLRSAMIKELMSVGSMSANKIGSLFHHPTDNSPEGDDINDSEYNDYSLGTDDNILLL